MKDSAIKYFYVLLCCTLVLVSCSSDDTTEDTVELLNETSVADQIFDLVNQHRQSQGLSALTKNTTAEELAIDHTRYMISQNDISHDGFGARSEELVEKENATSFAENVASTYPTPQAVMNGWLNSSGHKNNIEGYYTYIGVAAIKDSNGVYYYTQLFFR